jgi:hypothetical protein
MGVGDRQQRRTLPFDYIGSIEATRAHHTFSWASVVDGSAFTLATGGH